MPVQDLNASSGLLMSGISVLLLLSIPADDTIRSNVVIVFR